jgi:type I restriction enzyme M protein
MNNLQKCYLRNVVVSYDDIKTKNYSLSAGQYFDVKIEYVDITKKDFEEKMNQFKNNFNRLFKKSRKVEDELKKRLANLNYDY